jgi:hypothetical protein
LRVKLRSRIAVGESPFITQQWTLGKAVSNDARVVLQFAKFPTIALNFYRAASERVRFSSRGHDEGRAAETDAIEAVAPLSGNLGIHNAKDNRRRERLLRHTF